MQPSEYHRPFQSTANPATGQQEFHDPAHPLARKDGQVLLSRHLMSLKLGRWLKASEVVLLRDGDPDNLSEANLELTTLWKLTHGKTGKVIKLSCPTCGLPLQGTPPHKDHRPAKNLVCQRCPEEKFILDLEELRQLIWEMPIGPIAAAYGVTEKAIEKRCQALGIHRPPHGYWQKLEQVTEKEGSEE